MPNNQHAARLREMAETQMEYEGQSEAVSSAAAALLAGAEALEAVEVAKAALREAKFEVYGAWSSTSHADGFFREKRRKVYDDCVAALARLEGE